MLPMITQCIEYYLLSILFHYSVQHQLVCVENINNFFSFVRVIYRTKFIPICNMIQNSLWNFLFRVNIDLIHILYSQISTWDGQPKNPTSIPIGYNHHQQLRNVYLNRAKCREKCVVVFLWGEWAEFLVMMIELS